MRLRTRIITSLVALALGVATPLGVSAATADPPAPVTIDVSWSPDPATDAYNIALGDALYAAGFRGVAGDACECYLGVPVGTSVDVPGYGPFTVEP